MLLEAELLQIAKPISSIFALTNEKLELVSCFYISYVQFKLDGSANFETLVFFGQSIINYFIQTSSYLNVRHRQSFINDSYFSMNFIIHKF